MIPEYSERALILVTGSVLTIDPELLPGSASPSPISAAAPPAARDEDLESVQRQMFPGAVTLPIMMTGATDSAQLRARGVQAYGLATPGQADERELAHGNDERVPIAGVGLFVEYLYRVVIDIAGAK